MTRRGVPYDRLLALARRHSRTRDEAEDLVQAACLAALRSGRRDFSDERVMAWLAGTLRNLGSMQARSAARRRQREVEYARRTALADGTWALPDPAGLPPALARTARLISAGCTRAELRWLFGISDAALRQRLTAIRRVALTLTGTRSRCFNRATNRARLVRSATISDTKTLEFPVIPYFLVLLSPGENAAAAPNYYEDHVEHIDVMAAANVVLLGGEFDTAIDGATAAYLLHTSSRAEAEAWAAKDPLVSHGAYHARVVTWHLVGITPGAIDPVLTQT